LNKEVAGGLHPWSFHLANLCLHAVITGLVWLTALRILGDEELAPSGEAARYGGGDGPSERHQSAAGVLSWPRSRGGRAALYTAAVWTVHPMHTEAVSNSESIHGTLP